MLLVHKIDTGDKNKTKKSLKNRMAAVLLYFLIFSSFGLAGSYYFGSKSIEDKNKMSFVESGQYAITYSDGDKYILHKVQINEKVVIIKRNEQMVISNDKCTYTIKYVDEIKVMD